MSSTGQQSSMKQFFPKKTPGGKDGKKTPASVGKSQMRISAFFSKSGTPQNNTPGATPGAGSGTPAPSCTPAAALQPTATPASNTARAAATPGESAPAYSVGQRVRVFWPDEDEWYSGTIQAHNPQDNKHQVVYDDGDVQWEDLSQEQVEVLSPGKGKVASKARTTAMATNVKAAAEPVDAGLEDLDVTMTDAQPTSTAAPTRKRLVQGASQPAGKAVKSRAGRATPAEEALEDSGSEFEADSADDSGDESVDLEDEVSSGDDAESQEEEEEEEEAGKGKKRKRPAPTAKAATKSKPIKKQATGSSTPAPAPSSKPTAAFSTPATATTQRTFTATPQSGARSKLHSTLDVTPATTGRKAEGVKEVVHGVDTKLSNEDAGRFLARMAQRFPFLHPNNIMDAQRRKPTHPDYDPSTLYIPPTWFKEMKISEGQQQWWQFKALNFDSVLLFKMGKFYEMFEMDAYVGVDVLGLQFMKGDQPHAGFPEARYHDSAETLARAGYRVVVVEQTETPEQLARRNEERKKQGQKMAGVVNREKVAVLSKGTMIDAEMVSSKPDPSYVMAVVEVEVPEGVADKTLVTCLGVAAVDVASGHVLVGEFLDDEVRSSLRTHLTAIQPVELVLPTKAGPGHNTASQAAAGGSVAGPRLDPTTARVLKTALRDPRINNLRKPGGWTAQRLLQLVQERRYFKAKATDTTVTDLGQSFPGWPPVLKSLAETYTTADASPQAQQPSSVVHPRQGAAALSALCGLVEFLKDSLLDLAVLPQGRVEALPLLLRSSQSSSLPDPSACATLGSDEPVNMLLNGAALENLEILENADGGATGSLLSVVDSCSTPFGRRRLRTWLCRPLYRTADITKRQDAVAVLKDAPDAVGSARRQLAGVSDLERAVARLYSSTVAGASGRDASNVVLYEDAAKRKVKALTSAIRDLQSVAKAVGGLMAVERAASTEGTQSSLLEQMTDMESWGRVESSLEALVEAADWKQAEATGRVVPAEGVHEGYDSALEQVTSAERALAEYLSSVRSKLQGVRERDVQYVSLNKESHVIEVPEATKVPSNFTLVGQRKGFKRYSSERLGQLVADLAAAEEAKESALAGILQDLVVRFCEQRELWRWAVDSVADLDALMSLASHASNAEGAMCRPVILPTTATQPPVLEARGLRHPAGLPGRIGTFVPNDIVLGGDQAPAFIVLSGPNMGGKSTLLRQACLAAVLAQVGAWVPAESLTLTPVDAVFVRMGAKDSIMTGQSTFFVELAETAAMLNKATNRSLVALDELGRGTATLDGAAIASAVLEHMAGTVGCRGLFATHYHHLSAHYQDHPRVAIMHMACAVGGQGEEDMDQEAAGKMEVDGEGADPVQEVTFLYKLTPGPCPKSYGTNVARLAGLPGAVVSRAARMSQATEGEVQAAVAGTSEGGVCDMQVDGARWVADAGGLVAAVRVAVTALRQTRVGAQGALRTACQDALTQAQVVARQALAAV